VRFLCIPLGTEVHGADRCIQFTKTWQVVLNADLENVRTASQDVSVINTHLVMKTQTDVVPIYGVEFIKKSNNISFFI